MGHIAMVVTNACAPDPRVERHARWLVEEGHTVDIFAWDREMRYPALEHRHGYKIHRKQYGWTKKAGSIRTWFRKKKFIANLKLSADLVILNDTDTANVEFKGRKILDIHDMAHTWPLMRGNTPFHRFASRMMLSDAKMIMKNVDAIITSAPGFKKWIESEGCESTVIMNRRNPKPMDLMQEKVVGYFGRIRDTDSMSMMIAAAKLAEFRVIAAGDGLAVEKMLKDDPDMDYRGPFTEEELPKLIKEISVMYAMYSPERGNIAEGAIPTKMLDAAAFGRPSVVNQNTPMGELCENEKLGVTAPYGDIIKIAESLEKAHGMVIRNVKNDDRESFLSVIGGILD
jgi:glycosyltransferase involved in cell wall biosynthesis